ncbi:hypothetical protein [Falsihalocynthiibacter arcticus]|uniref:hypothetical protein n=1 Tax=Falsihalocynthiibacter arcticus TaxID=1579316 RepID=UPI0012E6FFA3|nr:hypothetical protein [Falsihalocynthiibacter arcticus]
MPIINAPTKAPNTNMVMFAQYGNALSPQAFEIIEQSSTGVIGIPYVRLRLWK